jgi:hypothetical protein
VGKKMKKKLKLFLSFVSAPSCVVDRENHNEEIKEGHGDRGKETKK